MDAVPPKPTLRAVNHAITALEASIAQMDELHARKRGRKATAADALEHAENAARRYAEFRRLVASYNPRLADAGAALWRCLAHALQQGMMFSQRALDGERESHGQTRLRMTAALEDADAMRAREADLMARIVDLERDLAAATVASSRAKTRLSTEQV